MDLISVQNPKILILHNNYVVLSRQFSCLIAFVFSDAKSKQATVAA